MRVLFVGLGSIGQRHVRNLRTLLGDGVEILAYRTRGSEAVLADGMQVESATGLHERYQIRVFTDLDDALAEEPTAAFVCNPNSLHLPVAMAVAKAGCHLFVEKPLSHDLAGVSELIRLVEEKDLVALVGYQLRFHPCIRTIQDLLREDRIGCVLAGRAVDGEYLPAWHPYEDYRTSYAAHRELGGGTLLARVHEMDYLYAFFGMPRRVFTLGGHLSDLEIDVEDVASTLLEYRDDGRSFPVHLHQDMIQRPPRRSCQIIGEDGQIEMDLIRSLVRVKDTDGVERRAHDFSDRPRNRLFLDELEHFLACLRGEARPIVTLRDGAQSLRMALAARESLETGRPVELSEGL